MGRYSPKQGVRKTMMHRQELERAANVIFRLCREHPELCPHDFRWHHSKPSEVEGKTEHTFVCDLCGREDIRIEDEE